MDNRPLALVIWTINVALLAVLAFVVYTFLLQPQSPGRPAYIPSVEDLPRLSEPSEWREIDVHELAQQYSEADRRPFNQPPYEQLSAFEYHRLHPPDPPPRIPEPDPDPEPVEDPPPTAEEALENLMQKVEVVMLSVPHRAMVRMPQRNERVTIAPPDRVGARGDVGTSPLVRTDLREFGIHADVLEIVGDGEDIGGVLMEYTYRDEQFTLLVPRPHSDPLNFVPGQDRNGRPMGEATTRPDETGDSGRADEEGEVTSRDEDDEQEQQLQGEPDPEFSDTRKLGENDWVIGWDEAGHVNENVDDLVDELRPRQYTDPDTGETHVQITNVPSESHAARRGFRSGDILKSINEVPVSSRDEAIDYVRDNLDEPEFRVVIVRQGREQRLTYRNPRYHSD